METKENEVSNDSVKDTEETVEKEHVMRVKAKDPVIVQMLYELKFIKHHLEFQNSLIQEHHNALIKRIDKFIIIFCAFMVMLFAVFALFFANGPQQTVKQTSAVVQNQIEEQKEVNDGRFNALKFYELQKESEKIDGEKTMVKEEEFFKPLHAPEFEVVDSSGKTSLVEIDKEDKEHEYRPKLNLNQNSR